MARLGMSFLLSFLFLCLIAIPSGAKKGKTNLISEIEDLKEFKKMLRTRTNLLVIFAKSESAASKSKILFSKVAEEVKGKGSLAFVDCSEAKKLCKNLKVSPSPMELRHYKDGDFNKNYDRQMVVKSLVNFMLDPTGDIPWDEEAGAEDVVHVQSEQEWRKMLRKQKLPILVMFYAPWCGYCKRLKPDYAAAATELKGQATLAGIDVDKPHQMALRTEYNITGFPTLLYLVDGQVKYKYGGENNKEGIIKWINNPGAPEEPKEETSWAQEAPEISHLHDDTFDDFIQTHTNVLVMFYAPWCGHCKTMKPEFQDAASRLKEENIDAVLAAVDATVDKKLGEEYKVQGFPTVKFFRDGIFAFDFKERTADKIVEFLKDPKEPPPPPAPEPKWEEVESDVLHLSDENFKSSLKKKKHALVMFYAPWCGHCKKAKPEFMSAASVFKEDSKVMFAGVDCTIHTGTCSQHDVSGYPTFKYFNYGKNTQKYMGGREEADFIKFMKDPNTEATPPPPSSPPQEEQWAEIEGKENVNHLSQTTFDSFVKEHNSVLVMFYAPWCGHCNAMKPAYAEAATLLAQSGVNGALAAIDATLERGLGERFGVSGYPTLKYFKNGEFAFDYGSGRKMNDLVNFMKDPKEPPPPPAPEPAWNTVPSNVKHLDGENFASVLSETDAALVMFYAPWCGHCKSAKPDFQSAAEKLKGTKKALAAVDCTQDNNRDLCSKEAVKGFPTIKLYIKGEFMTEYNGARSEDGFVQFLNNAPGSKEEL